MQEIDPDLAQQWLGQRTGLIQRMQETEQVRTGTLTGAAAMHLAMVDVLGDEATVRQIVERSRQLLATGSLPAMQQTVAQRRQAAQQQTVREAALAEENRTLKLQLAARGRNPAADRVDGTRAKAAGHGGDPTKAKNFDEYWQMVGPDLAEKFGWDRW